MHAGLMRNFQVMPGAEWLALLCKHVPDRYEHLVRYVGWYSIIRRILEHLGWWAPLAAERSPPPAAASWPWHVSPPLTYHPVPDIA
jgi:hypothetical protein